MRTLEGYFSFLPLRIDWALPDGVFLFLLILTSKVEGSELVDVCQVATQPRYVFVAHLTNSSTWPLFPSLDLGTSHFFPDKTTLFS